MSVSSLSYVNFCTILLNVPVSAHSTEASPRSVTTVLAAAAAAAAVVVTLVVMRRARLLRLEESGGRVGNDVE